jgi:hypothetical protein
MLLALLLPGLASAVTFLPPQSLPLGNTTNFAHALKTADLDHDGRRDIVVVDWVSNVLDVLIALPGGGFAPVVRYPAANAPYSVELVDLDGDTHLDAVTGNRAGASVSVYLGDGAGGFAPRVDHPVPAEVSIATVGDVTGDGHLDVVAAADLRICVLAGDGTGQLAAPTSTILGPDLSSSQVWGVALGDLDLDGDLDVVTNYRGPLVQLRNNGSGGFTRFDHAGILGARALAVADVTGDGLPDVVVAAEFQEGVVVYQGSGAGALTPVVTQPTGVAPWSLGIGDLDLDGRADVVTANIGSNTLAVLPGAGGSLGPPAILPTSLNPISVDVADMNGDGRLDIVETGYSGSVSIRHQAAGGGTTPSQTVLGSPSPVVYGAGVVLTATVTPSSAEGLVQFREGTTPLGDAVLRPGGVATLPLGLVPGGIHTYGASYSGDGNLAPSASSTIQVEVQPAPTTTTLETSASPAALGASVVFTATVVPTPASPMDGFVIFRLDGVLWQNAPVSPVTGKAQVETSSLPLGAHTIQASYEGTPNHLSSASPIQDQLMVGPEPIIVSIRDVPQDQGGRVTIKWDSPADIPGTALISRYRIWRRAPPGAAALWTDDEADRFVQLPLPGAAAVDYWEAVAELPAERLAHYAYTATTPQDSMAGSNPYTAFFVSALTSDPNLFFHSPVDSGYSVDNLAPPAPAPFSVVYGPSGNTLRWTPRRTPDLGEYRIHRGALLDFDPGPANQIAATRDSLLHDATIGSFVYKLVAVDVHGNPSRVLVATPDTPVGALASLTGLDVLADRVRLRWYSSGGAGTPATLYRRELETAWEKLAELVFDGQGHLQYEDFAVDAGRSYGYRLGILELGEETFTAEAWTEGPAPAALQLVLASANPSPTGRLSLRISLPSAASARLEVLDVAGRRLVRRDLTALGPGRHALTLDEGAQLGAGVYLLTVFQGSVTATRRVVVMP